MDNFVLLPINEFNDTGKFLDFCKLASFESSQPASINMWHKNWEDKPNTLPYSLFIENRFSKNKGQFHILLANNNIVACGGVYKSSFCKDIAIAGCRTWINKDFRNLSLARNYLLPADKKWAMSNNLAAIALTFNDYNKNIIEIWKRKRLGENRTPREPRHIFYNGLNEVLFPLEIQFTKQYLIYEILKNNWNFEWENIKFQD
jgi:hypothetical protein